MVFVQKFIENTLKIHDCPCFSVDFPGFSRITRVSDNQGFRSLRQRAAAATMAVAVAATAATITVQGHGPQLGLGRRGLIVNSGTFLCPC